MALPPPSGVVAPLCRESIYPLSVTQLKVRYLRKCLDSGALHLRFLCERYHDAGAIYTQQRRKVNAVGETSPHEPSSPRLPRPAARQARVRRLKAKKRAASGGR